MAKKNYAEAIYVASSFAALLIFVAAFIIYISTKQINIYLVVIGLLLLAAGFITKSRFDKNRI